MNSSWRGSSRGERSSIIGGTARTLIEGALRFDFDDGTSHTVHAGEVLVIPGDLPHSATAEEDCVDFDIFAPPRQDWINKDDAYLRKVTS